MKTLQKFSIIPLARIVRTHGFPKLGVCVFKADLFNHDATLFKGRKKIFITSDPWGQIFHPQDLKWKEVELSGLLAPLNGNFGSAKSLLIPLQFPESALRQHLVGLARSDLPLLKNSFYIHDLLGLKVSDENQKFVGTIEGFEDNGTGEHRSINFVILRESGKKFSVPSGWVNSSDIQKVIEQGADSLRIDDISQWFLDGPIPNDEN